MQIESSRPVALADERAAVLAARQEPVRDTTRGAPVAPERGHPEEPARSRSRKRSPAGARPRSSGSISPPQLSPTPRRLASVAGRSFAGARLIGGARKPPATAQIQQLLLDLSSAASSGGERPSRSAIWQGSSGCPSLRLRQAILGVVADGFLTRRRGLGTFVRERALDEKISILHSMTESLPRAARRGRDAGASARDRSHLRARGRGASSWQTPRCSCSSAWRWVEREPVALMRAYLSLRQFPGLQTRRWSNRSLYETLQEQYA